MPFEDVCIANIVQQNRCYNYEYMRDKLNVRSKQTSMQPNAYASLAHYATIPLPAAPICIAISRDDYILVALDNYTLLVLNEFGLVLRNILLKARPAQMLVTSEDLIYVAFTTTSDVNIFSLRDSVYCKTFLTSSNIRHLAYIPSTQHVLVGNAMMDSNIVMYNKHGTYVSRFGIEKFSGMVGMTQDTVNERVIVIDSPRNAYFFDSTGHMKRDLQDSSLIFTRFISSDPWQNLLVLTQHYPTILFIYNKDFAQRTSIKMLPTPSGVAMSKSGILVVANSAAKCLQLYKDSK